MKNENFTCRLVRYGRGSDEYEVSGTEGMTNEEIIDACDPYNWSGSVIGNRVIVYTD